MWKLTIEDDEGQRTALELSHDDYTIGRAEDASIRLTERNVSRRHAIIKARPDGGWMVEDAGSYNGTYVNGERVEQPRPLASGDTIQLGDYRIELLDQQVTIAAADEDPRKIRPDRMVMVIGPLPGSEYPLNQERLTIGRAEEANISINHASVSRMHCELVSLGHGRWEVIDQGSANGLRINGVELRRGMIEPGDALELGDVRLRYVAAGKYFRPGADQSMPLPAVVPFESMTAATTTSGAAPLPRRGSGAIAIAGAAVLALLVAGAVIIFRPSGGTGASPAASGTAMAKTEQEARGFLKDAQAFAKDGDLDTAHKILRKIPSTSPICDTKEFRELADRWADAQFAKAEKITDPKERARLLNAISDDDSVSADKRKRAASMSPEPPRPIDLDQQAPAGGAVAGSGSRQAPSAATNAPAATAATEAPPTPPPEKSLDANASTKRYLQGKMVAGTATLTELIQLKALCMAEDPPDHVCRNAAVAAINAKRNQ